MVEIIIFFLGVLIKKTLNPNVEPLKIKEIEVHNTLKIKSLNSLIYSSVF